MGWFKKLTGSVSSAVQSVGDKVATGAKTAVAAQTSALTQAVGAVGQAAAAGLAPVAQTGALQQVATGVTAGLTGSPAGLTSLVPGGDAGGGGFDFTSRLLASLTGAASTPAALGQSSVAGAASPSPAAVAVPWYRRPMVLAGAAAGALVLAVLIFYRRKARR